MDAVFVFTLIRTPIFLPRDTTTVRRLMFLLFTSKRLSDTVRTYDNVQRRHGHGGQSRRTKSILKSIRDKQIGVGVRSMEKLDSNT